MKKVQMSAVKKTASQNKFPSGYGTFIVSFLFVFVSLFTLGFRGLDWLPQNPAPGVMTELLFNEGTGTTTADGSGNGHTGTLVNSPVWGTGKYGQGLAFNGTNNYVNIADHADYTLDPAQSYTWSAWVKNNDFHEWSPVWSQTLDGNNFFYFYAHTTNDPDGGPVTNGISVYWWNNGGTNKLGAHTNNNVLTIGQWSYVTITYDASQPQNNRFTIYINGVDATNRTDVASVGTLASIDPTNIRIGSDQPFPEYLNGSVDEVRYYRRLLSLAEVQSDMNIGNAPDIQAPTVSITAPAAGNVSATINVTANAADNVGVAGVQFLLDGVNLGTEDIASPYSISWNTATATNGSHTLTARARDAAGNTTTSAGVIVTVNNDTQAPAVSITAPAAGTVLGTINVDANASDNVGVVGVQFLLDGANLGTEDVASPYSISWNTTTATNGNHTLTARARDAAGNITTSAGVIVNVSNATDTQVPTVSITAPAAGTVLGTINVDANASDNTGVVGVQFLLDGANLGTEDVASPYSISWNTTTATNGNHTITARARDAAGNSATSAGIVVTVNNVPDTQAPTVSITAPAAGTVTGTISVTANAADNIGVVGVQFLLNGANLGAEDVAAPYSISWNTISNANGNYVLTARARDAAGNTTTSSPLNVTVSNTTLLAALPLNEGTGTTTADISGNNHPGTLVNAPTWGAGKYGQALTFNGTNNYVNIPDHNDFTLDPTQSYTWSAWVKNTNFTEWRTVWSQTTDGNNFFYFYAHTSTDPDGGPVTNGISVYWWNSGGTNKIGAHSSNNVLTAGTWSYVAVTYDATQPQNNRFTIYVNGVDVTVRTDVSSTGTIATINPTNIRIGSNQPFGEYFNGSVDEVRYYKKLLSLSEVQTDMNTPLTSAPDLTAPTVSITAPAAGTVTGTISVTANASDNIGVAGVQFLLNGANLGTEDVASPYSISWNTTTVANGTYTLTARARDGAGNTTTSAGIVVTVNNDTQAPTVSITSPAAGTVLGTINVDANASDNVGVAGVQFLLDGVNLGAEDVVTPYTISWNTTTATNGTHTLTARARDAAGNTTTSAGVVVTVNNDIQAPAVSITAPAAGIVLGTINVDANASDNVGVAGVQFLLDGANLGAEDIAAPYTVSWNTTTIADGSHTLTARARDAAGNTTTSAAVVVTVQNNPPDIQAPTVSITAPAAGTVTGTISVTANAGDNVGVAGVQFLLNGANLGTEDVASPYSISWNTTTVANGTYTLTARARDAAGNTTTSAGVVVTVNNDTQAPTVSITAPTAGTVAGTISVNANAADNVGVAGVQFLLDGANLGTEDVASPYSMSWNTTTIADGSHTLTARARDASGNMTTSAAVVVTVQNDIQAPTVSITAPAAGNVSGTVNVTANASDNVGVVGVQFKLNGVNLGAEDVASPYSYSWNTSTSPNGNYTLTAVARDAAGNSTTSAGVNVTVSNASNLIAALPFNEGSGTATADISGNNHPGALTNAPVWGAGKYGQGLTFNGTNNYVNIVDHNDFTLDPTQSYTWSAWVKNASFKEWSTVWSQTLDGNNFFYFYAHTTSDPDGGPVTNGISVYWWAGGGSNKLGAHSNNNVLTLGQWSYVAVTYDASQPQNNRFSIYVNGADVTARTDIASVGTLPAINPTNIRIGSNQPFGEYLNGAVDEVRFYKRLLTVTEIATDMNTPMGVVADNTAPTVSITSPAGGNVSGTINVNANASDNIGVVGVQFLLDGVNLGAEDVASPYSVSWNTTTASGGNHILTARARDAAGNSTTSTGVTVTIVPDFSFTLLNTTRNVDPTGSTDFGVSIAYLNGFSSNVSLSVTGLPSGVTGNYVVNPMASQGSTQLLLTATNATPGVYTITLTATSGSIIHSQQATLIVNGGDDFGLTTSTSVQSVAAGSGTSYFINVTKSGNFAGTVNLSITGLPAGMTATFSPVSGVPPVTSVLTITTLTSTPVGNYDFTVQGTSGALVHTLPITLTVLATPPATWPVTNLGSGWDMPVGVLFTKDGQKMFVWEKGGKVYVCNRNATTQLYDKQATPVIDMSAEVGNWNDMGFLGFALDPNFETNGLIYMSYIVDRHYLINFGTAAYDPPPGDNASARQATIGRITRYQTVNNAGIITANLATRTILLGETKKTGIPILYDSHGVGTLAFAADGTLIASCGDAASYSDYDQGGVATTYYVQALADSIIRPNENVGSFRSQMLNCLNGKILRLNPANGDGVPSNPFYDPANPRSPKSRVYALGLRNPYRFSIKPGTGSTNPDAGDIGEIYVGDVGMGTWEELNVIKEPGTNCGWPFYEGLQLMPEFQNPVENKDEPNPLYGTGGCTQQYFTFQNLFKQITADNLKTVYNPCNASQPIGTGNRFVHRRPILDYKHDADVSRVGIFSGNTATVATIGTAASGVAGTPFRGNAITGGCWYTGTLFPTNFRNTFLYGDYGRSFIKSLTVNFTDVLQQVQHFADVATPVCLTENPLDGTLVYADVETNTIKRLSYGGNQFPVVKMTSNAIYGPSPLNVTFTGSGSYDPEGGRLTYSWNFGDGSAVSTVANPPIHSFTAPANTPTKYVVKLTVKDSVNATAVDSIIISVNNTPPVVNITSPIKNSTYNIGLDTIYAMTAAVTDAEHSNGQLKYEWQQILRHNVHEHPGPIDTARVTFGAVARIGCNGDDYYWLFRLKVTDAAGLSTMDSSKIFPNCSSARIAPPLRKFSVTPESVDKNLVKWTTDMAPQIRSFEVERSFDGVNFFTIASQDAKNTTGIKEYSFYDNTFVPTINYYRLKMIEIGDVARFSEIVKVVTTKPDNGLSIIPNSGLTIIPNPATSNFSVQFEAKENGHVTIRITDINGRMISEIRETVSRGQNIIYIENLPSWASGIYLVTVQQGNDIQKGKLMKAK